MRPDSPTTSAIFVPILTAGRTGSTFMTQFLERLYPEVKVCQEREPARIIAVLNNIANLEVTLISGLASMAARGLYRSSRKRWLGNLTGNDFLVEINPFVVGLGRGLIDPPPHALIHIVRHPITWVKSAIEFGSYSWRRPIVPYIPLVRERPPLGDPNWACMDEVERFAWRWRQRNRCIRACCEVSGRTVLTLRYEDLFGDEGPNLDLLKNVVSHMGLDKNRVSPDAVSGNPINPTLKKHLGNMVGLNEERIMLICSDEADHYGYN